MKRQLSKAARQEVVLAVRVRYQQATGPDQKRILDEFVAVTGYHRKHAIRVLAHSRGDSKAERQARPRLYDEAVREALILLWEASDRVCGKRLAVLAPAHLLPFADFRLWDQSREKIHRTVTEPLGVVRSGLPRIPERRIFL